MLQLSIQDYEGKSTVIPLADGELSIGRDESNSICLTERNVSRRHAVIMTHGTKVYLENVAATFGTRLNNTLLRERHQLQSGDVVQIGDYSLQVIGADQVKRDTALVDDAAPAKQQAPKTAENATAIVNLADIQLGMAETTAAGTSIPSAEQPRLVVESDNLRGWEGRITRSPTVVGRVAENADLVVDHRSISKEHARLTRKPDGSWEILDLGSANGIQVNGEPYSKSIIQSGDTVVLGHVTLRFLGAGERAPAVAVGSESGKSGGKGLIIAAVALLVLLAGAGLAFFVVGGSSDKTDDAAAGSETAGVDNDNADKDDSADKGDNAGSAGNDNAGGADEAANPKNAGDTSKKNRAVVADITRKVSKLEQAGMLDEALAFATDAKKKHPGSAELGLMVKRLQSSRKAAARLDAAKKQLKKDPKAVLDAMTDLQDDTKNNAALSKRVAVLKAKASTLVVSGLARQARKLLRRGRYGSALEKAEMCLAMESTNQACTAVQTKAQAKLDARADRRANRDDRAAAPRKAPKPAPRKTKVVRKPPPRTVPKAVPAKPAPAAAMSAKDYYKAGRKAAAGGDNRKAVGLFEKAVSAGYKRAHGKLARLYFQLGNKSKCASHGKRYINRYPDAGDAPAIEGLVEKCR